MLNYKSIINIDSRVRFGKPCVRNTIISVFDVLSWLAQGQTIKEIVKDFPEINETDIKACLAFAADREQNLLRAS